MPEVKMGLVAVSRGRLPIELPQRRLREVVAACRRMHIDVLPCDVIIKQETDVEQAVAEMTKKGANAFTIYLGNFGPEGATAILAQTLEKPVMLCGAAEESNNPMTFTERGDALCGLLSASVNCRLRHVRPYIPEMPIGLPQDIATMIKHFADVARVVLGVKNLKILSFGPRPADFYTCTAPIQPLYDLGVELMENSELDMHLLYQSVADRHREIEAIEHDMARELGEGNRFPEKLRRMAQFELALTIFLEANLGTRQYGIFANRCWPAFAKSFGFVPCFVNGRLASRGIPAACEADIYGALSQYMAQLATRHAATLLDLNNNVPGDVHLPETKGTSRGDLFMGYHCGNTPICCLSDSRGMSYQPIMNRLMENGKDPEFTCGTIEGRLKAGAATLFRIHGTPDCRLRSYVAEGQILEAAPSTFGTMGVFAIRDFMRFYRHVLLEKGFPHHTAVAFKHVGHILFDALQLLDVEDVHIPRPRGAHYSDENPFASPEFSKAEVS